MNKRTLEALQKRCDKVGRKTGCEIAVICVHHQKRKIQVTGSSLGKAFLQQDPQIAEDFRNFVAYELAELAKQTPPPPGPAAEATCDGETNVEAMCVEEHGIPLDDLEPGKALASNQPPSLPASLTNSPKVVSREVASCVAGPAEAMCVESCDEGDWQDIDLKDSFTEDDLGSQSESAFSVFTLGEGYLLSDTASSVLAPEQGISQSESASILFSQKQGKSQRESSSSLLNQRQGISQSESASILFSQKQGKSQRESSSSVFKQEQGISQSESASILFSQKQGKSQSKSASSVFTQEQGNSQSESTSSVFTQDKRFLQSKSASSVLTQEHGNSQSEYVSILFSQKQGKSQRESSSSLLNQRQGISQSEPASILFSQKQDKSQRESSSSLLNQRQSISQSESASILFSQKQGKSQSKSASSVFTQEQGNSQSESTSSVLTQDQGILQSKSASSVLTQEHGNSQSEYVSILFSQKQGKSQRESSSSLLNQRQGISQSEPASILFSQKQDKSQRESSSSLFAQRHGYVLSKSASSVFSQKQGKSQRESLSLLNQRQGISQREYVSILFSQKQGKSQSKSASSVFTQEHGNSQSESTSSVLTQDQGILQSNSASGVFTQEHDYSVSDPTTSSAFTQEDGCSQNNLPSIDCVYTLEHSYSRRGEEEQKPPIKQKRPYRRKHRGADGVKGSEGAGVATGSGLDNEAGRSDLQESGNPPDNENQVAEKWENPIPERDYSGTVISLKEYKSHWQRKHKNPKHRCDKCNAKFYIRCKLQKHKRRKCPANSEQYLTCALCGFEVSSLPLKKNHALMHINPQEHIANNTELCMFKCEMCGTCTDTEASFLSHECAEETKGFERYLKGEKPESIQLEYLDATQVWQQMPLSEAITIACTDKKQGKLTECFICQAILRFSPYGMKMHLLAAHAKEPFFYCRICDKRFRQLSVARKHKSSAIHLRTLEERGFSCKGCNTFFETKEKAEEHENSMCPTNSSDDVDNGTAEVDNKINKPQLKRATSLRGGYFLCDICGKSYTELKHLTDHWELRHRGRFVGSSRACDWCDALAETYNIYLEHIDVCPNRPVYKCSVCSFEANSLDRVKMHETVHDDQQDAPEPEAFPCETCEMTFACLAAYNRHVSRCLASHGPKNENPCDSCHIKLYG